MMSQCQSTGSTPGGEPSATTLTPPGPADAAAQEPVLCVHCGRTASNDISCQGFCVADSGY